MLIFVAIALLIFLPGPWNFVVFVAVLVLWVFELMFWNRTVRHRRRSVGAQTLLGRTASVIRACDPDGQVKVDGEIWEAHAASRAAVGQTVRIIGRNELVLVVEAIDDQQR
jgi:membrane protein implicated in regulation of membrane protease activity